MISKGTTHNNGAKLAVYMTTGKDGERAKLWQLRGFEATNIKDAFRDVQIMAGATRCEQPFFHLQVRNRDGEKLTREQWEYAADRIEKMLGLTGQPRAIAFHTSERNGHEHMHVAWSRIDQDTLTAKPLPFFKTRLKKISRELEIHFGLEAVTNEREGHIKYAPTRAEQEQARRLGLDIHEVRNTIRACYERSDCGTSFQAALEHEGFILARGERRDYVVVDRAGGIHALGKRILDVNKKDMLARLSDLDLTRLPTVEKAREFIQLDRPQEPSRLERLQQELSEVDKTIAAEREYARRDPVREDMKWHDAIAKAAIEKEKIEFVEQKREEAARVSTEKHWPAMPPKTETIKTSPEYHFEDAARETTRTDVSSAMPEKLRGTPAKIWTAWHGSDSAKAFAAALDEHGITLAVTTKEEADRSHRLAAFAQEVGNFAPRFREGEIVAIAEPDLAYGSDGKITEPRVYQLNHRTTGEERLGIEKFLRPLDRTQLQGIDATKESLKARVEQRIVEVQGFRELLRDTRNAERMKQAQETGRFLPRSGRGIKGIIKDTTYSKPPRLVGPLLETATQVIEGLFNLIDPPLTPARRREQEIATREREADAVDRQHERELSRHLAALREKEFQRQPEPEIKRKDRDRDR